MLALPIGFKINVLRSRDQSGSILIVVLWILVILTIFTAGISKRGQANMALSRYVVGETRAKYIALSGLQYAAARIAQDSADEESAKSDTLYQCGFVLGEGVSVDKLFKHVPVPGGHFDIVTSWQRADGQIRYGMSDEESRINLNAVTAADYQVLKFLIMDAGFEEDTAQTIAVSVVDWADQDSIVYEPDGKKDRESGSEQLMSKNFSFQSIQELLLVKGMSPEIFAAIKDHLAVFPSRGSLAINFNTASAMVLRSLARNFTGDRTNTDAIDGDSLAEKILMYRKGPDNIDGTLDDRIVEAQDLRLNSRENSIMAQMEAYRARVSSFLRLGVRAVDEKSGVVFRAEAVLSRTDGKIVYWHRIH
jgi:type II secretory pathway component PulK